MKEGRGEEQKISVESLPFPWNKNRKNLCCYSIECLLGKRSAVILRCPEMWKSFKWVLILSEECLIISFLISVQVEKKVSERMSLLWDDFFISRRMQHQIPNWREHVQKQMSSSRTRNIKRPPVTFVSTISFPMESPGRL